MKQTSTPQLTEYSRAENKEQEAFDKAQLEMTPEQQDDALQKLVDLYKAKKTQQTPQ